MAWTIHLTKNRMVSFVVHHFSGPRNTRASKCSFYLFVHYNSFTHFAFAKFSGQSKNSLSLPNQQKRDIATTRAFAFTETSSFFLFGWITTNTKQQNTLVILLLSVLVTLNHHEQVHHRCTLSPRLGLHHSSSHHQQQQHDQQQGSTGSQQKVLEGRLHQESRIQSQCTR